MQAVEICPQDKPLKEVLLTLGLAEWRLTDLHNVVSKDEGKKAGKVKRSVVSRGKRAVVWRLVCRVADLSILFA